MKLKEFINSEKAYKKAEREIRRWVEESYPGLTIEFNWPAPEIVQTDADVKYTRPRVHKITEAVNIKIGEVLDSHREEIYIADVLDRIYERHPRFNIDVENIEDLKRNRRFLEYFKELSVLN